MNARRPIERGSKEHRRRACDRKRRYPDHVSALAFAIGEMERNHGLRLDTYRCIFCKGWHLCKATTNGRKLFARKS